MTAAERTNDDWLADLRGDSPRKDSALADLRGFLLRGLRSALAGRPGAEEAMLEDTAQESLMKVLAGLGAFAGRSRFTTWAMSIAVRAALTELRRRRWKDVSLDAFAADAGTGAEAGFAAGGPDAWQPPDRSPGPAERAVRDETLAVLRRSVAEDLTDRQRLALTAELKGLPQAEIARRLGSNRNAIYKLTHDARKRLRSAL
jgi:RNA polymerase sigma-70 factor (ECF subfamily)